MPGRHALEVRLCNEKALMNLRLLLEEPGVDLSEESQGRCQRFDLRGQEVA